MGCCAQRLKLALFIVPVFVASTTQAAEKSSCPAPRAVSAAASRLLKGAHVDPARVEAAIDVEDLGDHYVVNVGDRARRYEDAARDCARRTQVAAVFVALSLAPPDIGTAGTAGTADSEDAERARSRETHDDSAGPRTETSTPSASAPPSAQPPQSRVGPGLSDTAQSAASSSASSNAELGTTLNTAPQLGALAVGVEARLGVGWKSWALALGAQLASASRFELSGEHLRQTRTTFDLALRHELELARLRAAAELGPALELLQVSLVDASGERPALVSWGGRARLRLSLNSSLSPYIAGTIEFFPSAPRLAVEPRGPLGKAAGLWVLASAGVRFGFP